MKRPTLSVCISCDSDEERGSGEAFFERLKEARKAQGLKLWFRLKRTRCLDGCDTPCNARLEGKKRELLELTWLDGIDDVQPLLQAAKEYATTGEVKRLPGRRTR
jgi:predicted metal-binding protein